MISHSLNTIWVCTILCAKTKGVESLTELHYYVAILLDVLPTYESGIL